VFLCFVLFFGGGEVCQSRHRCVALRDVSRHRCQLRRPLRTAAVTSHHITQQQKESLRNCPHKTTPVFAVCMSFASRTGG
jgi:hypothetical protein